ncbi:MAG: glycosyltransferase family 2 protein, partial [Muribaculaceae bacterium]|nr:glycosyltransferase family 2 protein [Muribaculaceae bacterium]
MSARLSIIIPVYNRESIVLRTLESVERQTLRPLKLILVDNGSSDGTLAVLEQWRQEHAAPGFEVEVYSEPVPGACAARNKGLAVADTEFVMFFDSD